MNASYSFSVKPAFPPPIRLIKQPNDRAIERAIEQVIARSSEQSSDRSLERLGNRALARSSKRLSDRAANQTRSRLIERGKKLQTGTQSVSALTRSHKSFHFVLGHCLFLVITSWHVLPKTLISSLFPKTYRQRLSTRSLMLTHVRTTARFYWESL